MGNQMDRRRRARLKLKVRAEVDRLVTIGVAPSERKLKAALPGHGGNLLLELRDELADAGLVAWQHPYDDAEADNARGISGATVAERAEVQARAAAIRAENTAAGRVAASAPGQQSGRVFRHPRSSGR